VFKDKLDYARDVRDGVIDDKSVPPVLYEWPRGDARRAGLSRPEEFLRHQPEPRPLGQRGMAREAELVKEQRGEGEGLQIFLAKHLNVEIGLRLRRDRWRGADYWEERRRPVADAGRACSSAARSW
jgi:phage terminase large subunit-like protein